MCFSTFCLCFHAFGLCWRPHTMPVATRLPRLHARRRRCTLVSGVSCGMRPSLILPCSPNSVRDESGDDGGDDLDEDDDYGDDCGHFEREEKNAARRHERGGVRRGRRRASVSRETSRRVLLVLLAERGACDSSCRRTSGSVARPLCGLCFPRFCSCFAACLFLVGSPSGPLPGLLLALPPGFLAKGLVSLVFLCELLACVPQPFTRATPRSEG